MHVIGCSLWISKAGYAGLIRRAFKFDLIQGCSHLIVFVVEIIAYKEIPAMGNASLSTPTSAGGNQKSKPAVDAGAKLFFVLIVFLFSFFFSVSENFTGGYFL